MKKINLNTTSKTVLSGLILISCFILGYLLAPDTRSVGQAGTGYNQRTADATWTCSMHPQIKLPEPGQCPICFMDLIPLDDNGSGEGPIELTLSERAVKLADISVAPVQHGVAQAEVLLSGKVDYDETRVKTISAWIPGRLERLFVDYTGITVNKGEHLFEIYSPELYVAQAELVQVINDLSDPQTGLSPESYSATYKATRRKLAYLGMTEEQIDALEDRGGPSDRITITSPLGGVVIHKNAVVGRYVDTGSPIYTIADLSRVWVVLDAYESDLPFLRFGQKVQFTTEALPGQTFDGRITFIDPILDTGTRTVQVRINLLNHDQQLKPGMFVRASIEAILDAEGLAVNPQLANKWICPMHPEIVKEEPGICDVCEMDLVPSEDLGIVNMPENDRLPLLVPATAVLKTGKRALVYIRDPGAAEPTFASREVQLGPRVGDHYIIRSGLTEGELVVVNGNFKIDSAMQLAAKPSMMNPAGGVSPSGHQHSTDTPVEARSDPKSFNERMVPFGEALALVGSALEDGRLDDAKAALAAIRFMTGKFDMVGLSDGEMERWHQAAPQLEAILEHADHWVDPNAVQQAYEQVNTILGVLSPVDEISGEQVGHD